MDVYCRFIGDRINKGVIKGRVTVLRKESQPTICFSNFFLRYTVISLPSVS